ncbi:MAG: response regulator [Gemmatimonadetes bacterium]|jgi:CheY-like chemotaxis protein|nr:response regulator [Gemmatimonadota bacterium]
MASLLYVDDEETIGRAVSRWFERRGHEVHVARSIEDAKQILAEHEPAAIFLDVWLGRESGFELLGWIEDEHPELANRVTFVTGELADAQERARAPEQTDPREDHASVWRILGRPVLQKPFELAQLEVHAFGLVDAPGETGT